MDRLVPVLLLLLLFIGAIALMRLGWRRRAAAQREMPAPEAPAGPESGSGGDGPVGPFPGVYVSTVFADRPFERVVAHGLGVRSRVSVSRAASGDWTLERRGAPSLVVRASQVRGVATAPGMAGKVVGGDGLLVLRWNLGETAVDTGLRMDHRNDHERLLAAEERA